MDDDDEKSERRGSPPGQGGVGRVGPSSSRGQRPTAGKKPQSGHLATPGSERSGEGSNDAVGAERIAKRLARAGIASRRDAEDLIAAGRVSVNGRALSSPAFNVMPDDIIAVDGTPIPPIERTRLFLFHKAAGLVTTNRDPEGRRTVFDVLPPGLPRLMTIGRLDINTEGLLLLTNDGGLARVLELPSTGWLRRYRVRVHGRVDRKALADLREGIAVDGVFYGSVEATLDREQGSNAWLTIGLREGKNREVKNILGALGLEVSRLIRISYGPFQLGDLPEGHIQELRGRLLRDQLGERLIEEAGANFEAPVLKSFSNKPVRTAVERPVAPKVRPDRENARIGEGGLIRKRKRRENMRSEALGKLSTRPNSAPGPKAGARTRPGSHPDRASRPQDSLRRTDGPGARTANVWMAPGARPVGTGRAAAGKMEADPRNQAGKSAGSPASGKGGRGLGSKARGRSEAEPESAAKGPAAGDRHKRPSVPGNEPPRAPSGRPSAGRGGRPAPRGRGPSRGPRQR